ncbi:MAG: 4-hydroxythreonine-4-phosphate dehydrogenase PdxA [Saprospiraceae bacterium]|nr:4-hydroxythreonine-4-phosphate dehydrogenase PdxA [Bacteroidia bacterium]MBT8228759.1 4-hydroxythreonine-4-phosphate dehydrogenase PdxA [Bacteroidia bacterium]NNF21205.1 4-hydroxythreonine-4-phosphate dehydrogenase PdxA [Saprospiraceae bacterium]NNK89505.1 4-hydroxythreonine-4-phosphate dehydrogenase PdxA [Saprospiraceae bacterium]
MSKIKIGITIGDMNGIGPEVIIKALAHPKMTDFFIPIIYGSSKIMSYHKNIVKDPNFTYVSIRHADNAAYNKVNVMNVTEDNINITLGQATEEGGKIAYLALEKAVEDAQAGRIDAIVTAPINKAAMEMAGFKHVGHTEFLTEAFAAPESVMTMVSEDVIISLASNHVSMKDLPEATNKNKIIRKLKVLSKALKQDFAQEKPTIAVLGLNPHAGDKGVIGTDEEDYIIPAIKEAKNNGVLASGPYSADGFFGTGGFKKVNAILAMYHDQGLIPFKLLSFGNGVNFTAGLPVVRTSPDHGTAYDIAGRNMASGDSMRRALFLAKDLYKNREQFIDDTKDPVKKAPKPQEEIQE